MSIIDAGLFTGYVPVVEDLEAVSIGLGGGGGGGEDEERMIPEAESPFWSWFVYYQKQVS